MRAEDLVLPAVIFELEDRYRAVRRRARQEASRLVRRPRHNVDCRRQQLRLSPSHAPTRGRVEGKVEDSLPVLALASEPSDPTAHTTGRPARAI